MNRAKNIRRLVEDTAPRKDMYPDILQRLAHLQQQSTHSQNIYPGAPTGPSIPDDKINQHVSHFGKMILDLINYRDSQSARSDVYDRGHKGVTSHIENVLKGLYHTRPDFERFKVGLGRYLSHHRVEKGDIEEFLYYIDIFPPATTVTTYRDSSDTVGSTRYEAPWEKEEFNRRFGNSINAEHRKYFDTWAKQHGFSTNKR